MDDESEGNVSDLVFGVVGVVWCVVVVILVWTFAKAFLQSITGSGDVTNDR